jgi:hypothetical protein
MHLGNGDILVIGVMMANSWQIRKADSLDRDCGA